MNQEERLDLIETELRRLNGVINIEHSKLNQLTVKFNAHRDKKDIHDKRILI